MNARGRLRAESFAEPAREFEGFALAPKVNEEICWLITNHVIVKGDDVNASGAQRAENGLDLGGLHREVTVDGR